MIGVVFCTGLFLFIFILLDKFDTRIHTLEEVAGVTDRKRTVARMLAIKSITPTEAKGFMSKDCICLDLSTPTYPEFAAVMFDSDCPVHKKE